MAKLKTKNPKEPSNILPVFFSDISYVAPEFKNERWAAEMLYYMKRNFKLFLDPNVAAKYRATDNLELDEKVYKQMVDPITPMGGGGTASYFSSNFKANPCYIHLKNIIKAEIQKAPGNLEVNMKDKYAKTRKMREENRIVYQHALRELINEYAPLVGLKGISDKQDPYKWIKSLQAGKVEGGKETSDVISSFSDLIKNYITDSEDLALYSSMVYKGDYEIAFEIGIKYYLIEYNKWIDRWSDEFLDDIMHFNKACGEWYTDEISGRPIIERFVPERLCTSHFRRKDGEDLMYYFIEYEITFADFVKEIGKGLPPQKLKDVFQYNKMQGSSHGLNWIDGLDKPNQTRDNAKIRVGKAACLTQDYEIDLSDYTAHYPRYQSNDISWKPLPDEKANPDTKHYNVWYSWYYIPPSASLLNNSDYAWQSQFIFNLKKNQDQFRYGEDGRYSKSPLVIYDNGRQASYSDIIQNYMPLIHTSWHNLQNCLVNDFEATILADEFLGGLLAAVDEDNKIDPGMKGNPTGGNGRDAMMEQWKMIKQSGKGFLKMTDKNGVPIVDPSKLVLNVKNNYLDRAEKYIAMMAMLYQEMTRALAMTDAREGQDVKPRTPVAAIEEGIKASNKATWFIQLAYETFLKMYAERIVRYIIEIAHEKQKLGYSKRFDEFMDIVGQANAMLLEGMADVPPESIGMTVSYVDNTAKKDFMMQLAMQYVAQNQLDNDFIYLLMGADNWKEGFCLMRLGIKKRKAEMAEQAAQQQQYVMEQKQMDLQIAQQLNGQKYSGIDQNIMTAGKVDAAIAEQISKLKLNDQLQIKETIKNNKMEQDTHKENLKQQAPLGVA